MYEQPETAVIRVELESPICSGSVDMTAETPHGGNGIQAQDVNTDFGDANDFTKTENTGENYGKWY